MCTSSKVIFLYTSAILTGLCIGIIISWTLYIYSQKDTTDIQFPICNNDLKTNNTIAYHLGKQSRILCWIMVEPEQHYPMLLTKTWGKRCDILLFMDTKITENWLNRIKEALKQLYSYYLQEVDWFLYADSKTYVIMENLKLFLYGFSPDESAYFETFVYSNVSGHIMSKMALKTFVEKLLANPSICDGFSTFSNQFIGKCLKQLNIRTTKQIAYDNFDLLKLPLMRLRDNYNQIGIPNDVKHLISLHNVESHALYNIEYFLYIMKVIGINNYQVPHEVEADTSIQLS